MATFTEHYDLIKPGTDDYYDVADFNENMDAIDTQLYQAEQDMAGVSEKIGNPGDQGTDTIFGLLHPDNQPEEKADLYRYSKTDIQKRIQNWTIPAVSGLIYGKLVTVLAEKNGSIYVKLDFTAKSDIDFVVFDRVISTIFDSPDQTTYGGKMPEYLNPKDFSWFSCGFFFENTETQTYECILPVTAGSAYSFFIYGTPGAAGVTINDFIVGYTDAKEA